MKILSVFLALLFTATFTQAAPPPLKSKYDGFFIKYTNRYLLGVDPDLIKAQCWQESRFVEMATSQVGAGGICQFMPATWREAKEALSISQATSVYHPEYNIQAAAYYMAVQYRIWKSPRPPEDRHNLATASYNGGAGNLISAQKLCNGSPTYKIIIPCLPRVTGKHSKETIDYVVNVRSYYAYLKKAKGQVVPNDGL
jgi:membrane-bound lytic murein transglycosylase F